MPLSTVRRFAPPYQDAPKPVYTPTVQISTLSITNPPDFHRAGLVLVEVFVVRTPAYRKEGNVCKGNLSRVSLARSVTRPQATGFALQNRTNTKKDTQKRVFFVL